MDGETHDVLKRQPDESSKAWDAWLLYRDMGSSRTQTKVGQQLGKSHNMVNRWGVKYRWRERIIAFETQQDAIKVEAQQRAIANATAKTVEKFELSRQRTLLETARLSYSDITKAVQWDAQGNLTITPSDELDEDTRAAISSIKLLRDKDGNVIPEIKFHNKIGALNLAGQHHNLWKSESQQVTNNNYLVLLGSLKDLGEKLANLPPGAPDEFNDGLDRLAIPVEAKKLPEDE